MTSRDMLIPIYEKNNEKAIKSVLKHTPGEEVRWLEVAYVKNIQNSIGISCDGYWVIQVDGGVIKFTDGDYVVSLLPCLKYSHEEFLGDVFCSAEKLKIKGGVIAVLPVEDIIDTGLLSIYNAASALWLDLSLDWIFQIGFVSERLRKHLLEISRAERGFLPQPSRHRAKKLSKLEGKEFF
jgi:hypothetical protein